MKDRKRPVNLDLSTIRFPITAIVSILHRVTGVLMLVSVPLLVAAWAYSLQGEVQFRTIAGLFTSWPVKLLLWGFVSAVLYHLLAGIRHLVMDFGIGETLEGGRASAKYTLASAVFAALFAGVWLW